MGGWTSFPTSTKCYKYVETSPAEAGQHCAGLTVGGELASAPDRETNDFIRSLTWNDVILGAERTGGEWRWTDGTVFSFTNWGEGEPRAGGERVLVSHQSGQWSAVPEWSPTAASALLQAGTRTRAEVELMTEQQRREAMVQDLGSLSNHTLAELRALPTNDSVRSLVGFLFLSTFIEAGSAGKRSKLKNMNYDGQRRSLIRSLRRHSGTTAQLQDMGDLELVTLAKVSRRAVCQVRRCSTDPARCHAPAPDCCSAECPCAEGAGLCRRDEDCEGELGCGHDNCPGGHGHCCTACSNTTGCSSTCPCDLGESGCNQDDHCRGDLKCGTDGVCCSTAEGCSASCPCNDGEAGCVQAEDCRSSRCGLDGVCCTTDGCSE